MSDAIKREPIKRIDAAEFAAHAATYLAAGEPLDIEQDGRVIGRYWPIPVAAASAQAGAPPPNGHATNGSVEQPRWPVDPQKHADMERLGQILQEIYAKTGLTEDEFADLMDPGKPFPYDKAPYDKVTDV